MASAEKALIQQTDYEQEIDAEPILQTPKDTKYSWFVCSCTFICQVFTLGVLHAFGVFFIEFVREFETSKGDTAWVGSLAYGLSMTIGPITSIMVTRHGYSRIMMTGGFLCATSLIISSFVETLPMMFLTFSILYGIGASFACQPTMTIQPEYFDKYLTIATGITVSGSSFGTLIMGPLAQAIIDSGGWRNAFRIFAGLNLFTILLTCRIRSNTAAGGKQLGKRRSIMDDMKIWNNRVFVIWTMSITLVMFGFYIPYVHLVSYAVDQGISQDRASLLMMVLGATTATGRLLFGKIVQMGILNRIHMHQLSMVVTGAGVMLLPLITSYAGIVAYVVTVGLVDGCYVVLLPILTTSLVGVENSVIAWGFLIGTSSITFTLGPPVAGALYDMTGNYDIAFHCAGIPIIGGAIVLFFIPWAKRTTSQPNVMELMNEYNISAFDTEPEAPTQHSESVQTMLADEGVVRQIEITRSHMTVRTTGTSPINIQFMDKATSTSPIPRSRYQTDYEDVLSQLSYNDQVFSEILRRSYNSSLGPDSSSLQGMSEPPSRVPCPPTIIPGSASTGSGSQRLPPGAFPFPRSGSVRDEASFPSYQPSLQSSSRHSDMMNQDMYLPSASEMSSLSGVAPQAVHSLSHSGSVHSRNISASQSNAGSDPTKQSSKFDQTISAQVEKLRERLKSPPPESESFSDLEDREFDAVMTQLRREQECRDISRSTTAPRLQILATTDPPEVPTVTQLKSSTSQPANTAPVASGVEPKAKSNPETHEQIPGDITSTSLTENTFEHDHQLTVRRNPLVTQQQGQSSDHQGRKLEDLFKAPEEVAEQSTSYEVVSLGSDSNVAPTKSQISELDVFKHLFDDEGNNID